MPTVTLVGDRQSGKTHALLAIGASDASRGATVLYIAEQFLVAVNAFETYMSDHADKATIDRISRGNGKERVTHRGGGSIRFTSMGRAIAREFYANPERVDTLLLDDGATGFDQYGVDYGDNLGWPDIHVYRTSL